MHSFKCNQSSLCSHPLWKSNTTPINSKKFELTFGRAKFNTKDSMGFVLKAWQIVILIHFDSDILNNKFLFKSMRLFKDTFYPQFNRKEIIPVQKLLYFKAFIVISSIIQCQNIKTATNYRNYHQKSVGSKIGNFFKIIFLIIWTLALP
jgi:hypothetical protein